MGGGEVEGRIGESAMGRDGEGEVPWFDLLRFTLDYSGLVRLGQQAGTTGPRDQGTKSGLVCFG